MHIRRGANSKGSDVETQVLRGARQPGGCHRAAPRGHTPPHTLPHTRQPSHCRPASGREEGLAWEGAACLVQRNGSDRSAARDRHGENSPLESSILETGFRQIKPRNARGRGQGEVGPEKTGPQETWTLIGENEEHQK